MTTREVQIVADGIVPEQWTYSGPGWVEWVFSFGVTALTANSLVASGNMSEVISAERFYSAVPGVNFLHTAAYVVNIGILVLVALWVFLFRRNVPFAWVVVALAVLGAGFCWAEVVIAAGTQPNPIYILRELPFRPVNNLGLAGAQIFLTYLIFKIPDGATKTWPALCVKAALAGCLWLVQLAVWDALTSRMR